MRNRTEKVRTIVRSVKPPYSHFSLGKSLFLLTFKTMAPIPETEKPAYFQLVPGIGEKSPKVNCLITETLIGDLLPLSRFIPLRQESS